MRSARPESIDAPLVRAAVRLERALARPRLLSLLLVVYVPFFVLFFAAPVGFSLQHAAAACHGRAVLDQRWGYSPTEVADYLRACGAGGRAAIAAQQNADLVYPLLFGLVLAVSFSLLLRRLAPAASRLHLLVLLPLLATVADYVENAGIRALLALYPAQPAVVPVLSFTTATKLTLGWAGMAALAVLLVVATARRMGNRAPGADRASGTVPL